MTPRGGKVTWDEVAMALLAMAAIILSFIEEC